jgi:GNAT superfamily N-acetyltransferase
MSRSGEPAAAVVGSGSERASGAERSETAAAPGRRLPTLQQNALRKIFDRPDFSPEEVARLGHRRLQRAEGIGRKGLQAIVEWLREQGYELQCEPPAQPSRNSASVSRDQKKLEKAMRILKTHGYAVLRVGNPDDGGEDYCL